MTDWLVGTGKDYSSINAALAAISAYWNGTTPTSVQNVICYNDMSTTYLSSMPTQTTVPFSLRYPIVIKSSDAANPVTITQTSAGSYLLLRQTTAWPHLIWQDINISGNAGFLVYNNTALPDNADISLIRCKLTNMLAICYGNARQSGGIYAEDCQFTSSSCLFQNMTYTQVRFKRCKMVCDGILGITSQSNGNSADFIAEECAIYSSAHLFSTGTAGLSGIKSMTNCTIAFSTSGKYIYQYALASGAEGMHRTPILKGCLIDNATGYMLNYYSTYGPYFAFMDRQTYAGNNWSNLAAGDYFIYGSNINTSLANWKSIYGGEEGSTTTAVTFASTTITSDSFLKPTSAIYGRVFGASTGIGGNARLTFSANELGCYQQSAVTIDASKILTTASPAGTFDEAARNIVDASKYLTGNSFTYRGISTPGTYAPDFPDLANVLNTDTVNGVTGTFNEAARNTNPGVANVLENVSWKTANVTYTGELVIGDPPTAPTAEIVDNANGTGAVATIVADALTANVLYTAPYGSSTWTNSGSRIGSGTISLSLSAGIYSAYVSSSNGSNSVSKIYVFAVTTGAESDVELILDDMKAMIEGQLYKDAGGHALTVSTPRQTYPLAWKDQEAAQILIMPEGDPATPNTTGSNAVTYNVTVCIAESLGTVSSGNGATFASHSQLRQAIRRLFLGKRLLTFTDAVVSETSSSEFFNQDQAQNYLGWLPITFNVEVVESR